MSKNVKIRKVLLTGYSNTWWESDLNSIASIDPSQIISVIEKNCGLYLIYWYEEPENKKDEQ